MAVVPEASRWGNGPGTLGNRRGAGRVFGVGVRSLLRKVVTMTDIVIGERALAEALATAISGRGRRVVAVASTAAELMAAVDRTSPDVCLLDRWFDDADALDLLTGLRERSPRTRIVVLSADTDHDVAEPILARGAHGFVHKTRGVSALLGAVERVLAGETVVELPPRWGGGPVREVGHERHLSAPLCTSRDQRR